MSNNNNNNDDDNSDNDNKTPTSYSPNVDYDYIDKIYAAENEAERRTIALNNVYELARKKIRAAGGMMTQQDAMKEILREEKESYARGIEELYTNLLHKHLRQSFAFMSFF